MEKEKILQHLKKIEEELGKDNIDEEKIIKDIYNFGLDTKLGFLGKRKGWYTGEKYIAEKYSTNFELIPTGFDCIDKYAQFKKGKLSQIYALTNHGKSAFMRSLALNQISYDKTRKVAIFTYEDSEYEVLSHLSYMSYLRMYRSNKFDGEKKAWLADKISWYRSHAKEGDFFAKTDDGLAKIISERILIDSVRHTTEMLEASIRKTLEEYSELDIVYIDYVQRIKPDGKYENRQIQLQTICEDLQDIASQYNVAIVSAAQLLSHNHGSKKEDFVSLFNVREAKDISNSADLVLGLWNESEFQRQRELKENEEKVDYCEVDILKQKRQRSSFGIPFSFENDFGNFVGSRL